MFPGKEIQSKLHVVQIYFDTATFDDIERDKKIKIEAQLSLIGGTIGLLTGFSIISGVEIIFYLVRLIWSSLKVVFKLITLFRLVGSFRIRRANVVAVTKENHFM